MRPPRSILLVLLSLSLPVAAFCQAENWEVLTSVHTVRQLIRVDGDLWCATNGGLYRFDPETGAFQSFTNVEGLSSNDILAMTQDERGNLLLGMDNGYMDVFDLASHQVTPISDFALNPKIFQIYALYNDSGTIYAGTDIGVSRLVYLEEEDRYLIEGNFNSLGAFPPEIAVKSIRTFDGGLWVATPSGVARGDLSIRYLEFPSGWQNYTTDQGLSDNDVAALEVFQDALYAAASATGLNRLTGSAFIPIAMPSSNGISFLKAQQDTLYAGRSGGLYYLGDAALVRLGPTQAKGLAIETDETGAIWGGFQIEANKKGGLYQLSPNRDVWLRHTPDAPVVELVSEVLIEPGGGIWIGGKQDVGFNNGALSYWNGNHWINLVRQDDYADAAVSPDSFFWYQIRALVRDDEGGVWVGSDGRGVGWFRAEGDTVVANAYYSNPSGKLAGIDGDASYTVVRDLEKDGSGNIWICNSEADPLLKEAIAIVPSDFIQDTAAFPNWDYASVEEEDGSIIQYAEFYVDRLVIDSYGRKWFGANNNTGRGIHILDDSGTDEVWYELTNLPSDSITALALDRDGIVWVGTVSGVQYFYPQENPQDLIGTDLFVPVGPAVASIGVDPQNNKWFGTATGLSVLGADNYTWLSHYTTQEGDYPSPLPGNLVQAISFDPINGYAYLGTDKGLARLNIPYKGMGESVTGVNLKPNPFRIGSGLTDRLTFDPLSLDASTEMRIYTTSGLLVRQLGTNELNMGWDGRNSRQELVATGIYFVLAYSADGSAEVGKVAVIRQ